MRTRAALFLLPLLMAAAACDEDPTGTDTETPPEQPRVLGLVEITLSGIGTEGFTASARSVEIAGGAEAGSADGPRLALNPIPSGGIQLESYSNGSFVEGTRGSGGQRYMNVTFRVRNAASNGTAYGVARSNLTFIPVSTSSSASGTPITTLRRFDNSTITGADRTRIATNTVPTAAVVLGDSMKMEPAFVDVLQVFQEAEVSAVSLPSGVTGIFPYGFVVRNPKDGSSRTLPANPATDQWDGLVTFAYRVPLEPHDPSTSNGATKDPFAVSILFLVLEDTETRVTEAIEEQTAGGRAKVAARATALGATTVTVLAGSPSTGYTGQRQICAVRTAGASASPAQTITMPGAYTHLRIYREGETHDACAPNFIGGTMGRPGMGLPFNLTVKASDRYGNVMTTMVDSVRLTSTDASTTMPARTALTSGQAVLPVTFHAYGYPVVTAVGRRLSSARTINVNGITRTWTGAVSTDWSVGGNWDVGVAPASLDSAVIPTGVPRFPTLTSNVNIGGVTVADGATLNLSAFNLTASSSVLAGTSSGGITNTTGTLFLTGIASQVQGILPRVRISGTYSQVGNITARAPLQVDAGRLTNGSFRTQVSSY